MSGRLLGLDVGEKRIGVALSDPEGLLASPLKVISITEMESAIDAILGIVTEHRVKCIVVGMPRSLNGSFGPQAERVRGFIQKLSRHCKVPVGNWDERLSTVAAERVMREGGLRLGRDAAAAALILQGYLDRMGSVGVV